MRELYLEQAGFRGEMMNGGELVRKPMLDVCGIFFLKKKKEIQKKTSCRSSWSA